MGAPLIYVTQVAPHRDGPAGVHGVLGQSAMAMAELAEAAGVEYEHVTQVREITSERLHEARVIALFTIGETPWSAAQRAALLDGVRSGTTGVLAIHAATDSCYGWDAYGALVGARFDGHPWTQEVDLVVCDPVHPAVAHLGALWRWRDEVYRFRGLRPDAQILLRVDETGLDMSRTQSRPSFGFPVSWCHKEGGGRVFSTSLGHFPAAWESVTFLRHVAGGLEWILTGAGSAFGGP